MIYMNVCTCMFYDFTVNVPSPTTLQIGFIVSPYCTALHYNIKNMTYHHLSRADHDP